MIQILLRRPYTQRRRLSQMEVVDIPFPGMFINGFILAIILIVFTRQSVPIWMFAFHFVTPGSVTKSLADTGRGGFGRASVVVAVVAGRVLIVSAISVAVRAIQFGVNLIQLKAGNGMPKGLLIPVGVAIGTPPAQGTYSSPRRVA